MSSSKKVYIFSLAAIVALSGCGSHDDDYIATSTTQAPQTQTILGKVIDGYIKNATVCIDTNENNKCDEDEATIKSNADGSFELNTTQKGSILAYGGIDLDTNLPFEGVLKAPEGFSNITPLTTLVAEYSKNVKDLNEALSKVAKLFGLNPEDIKKDPIEEVNKNPNLLKASLILEKTLEALSTNQEELLKNLNNFVKVLNKAESFEELIDEAVEDEKKKESLKNLAAAIKEMEIDKNNLQDVATLIETSKESIKNGEEISKEDLLNTFKSCQIDPNWDDSSFVDTPPNGGKNIPYFTIGEKVSDIEAAFNYARSLDSTVKGKKLILPSQEVWDKMSKEDQALYILNRERVDRGLKPFEGVFEMNEALKELKPQNPKTLADVAQGYTNLLYESTSLSHTLDGTPTQRIERVASIKDNKEYIPYNESLYAEGNSYKLTSIPLIKAIYTWIYADAVVAEGKPWGHRAMCLMKVENDDFGIKGAEGLLAFGLKQGNSSKLYPNFWTSIVTMNAINPLASFNGEYKKSKLCYGENKKDDRFIRENGLIKDTKTSLIWQDINLTQANLNDAKEYCQNLTLGGFNDWRLPKATELSEFYKSALSAGVTPNLSQINISKMSADGGFVFTTEGAKKYNREVGSITNDFAPTSIGDVRCVRGEAQTSTTTSTTGSDEQGTNENITLDNSNGIAIDNSQNLMFENNPGIDGKMNIEYGKIACNNLELGGFKDWRLPTPTELSTFHKNAFDENVTLNYNSSYCTYEITNDGEGNNAKAVRVQKSDDNYQIGDIVNFSGSGGIRCTRTNQTPDSNVDTIPPARVVVDYTGDDKIAIDVSDEEDIASRSYVEINYDCDDSDSNNVRCKDFSILFKGEAGAKLYKLDDYGKLDQEVGTLDGNGELSVDFADSDMNYIEGINSKEGHFYDKVGDFVLVDDSGNISKVNTVWVEFYVPDDN
jgi:phage anti-repressor protein